jgi:hypothetical protein
MLLFRFSYAFSSSTKLGFARKTSAIKERLALHYTQLDLQSESSYYQCSIEEYLCSKTLLRLVWGSRSSSRDISCVNWSSYSTRSSSGRMAGKPYINGTKIICQNIQLKMQHKKHQASQLWAFSKSGAWFLRHRLGIEAYPRCHRKPLGFSYAISPRHRLEGA